MEKGHKCGKYLRNKENKLSKFDIATLKVIRALSTVNKLINKLISLEFVLENREQMFFMRTHHPIIACEFNTCYIVSVPFIHIFCDILLLVNNFT